jgi:hypothetical protein
MIKSYISVPVSPFTLAAFHFSTDIRAPHPSGSLPVQGDDFLASSIFEQ